MEYTLPNGEKLKVNDHVYCSPSWVIRDGTPYSIARIMEFLPGKDPIPQETTKTRSSTKEPWTRVRVAWFYRPSDVSDRPVNDSRLLLCAIYSEVIPITQLRGKCYVKHKDKIVDLIAWRKRPDCFYYNRLFDPFIKREFEVILVSEVQNLPRQIKDVLTSRYEMIVTEKECVAELTDSLRLCDSCGEWCPSADSVQCDTCKCHFHMACVQPPLLAKPARGYGWSCARCSQKDDDDENGQLGGTSKSKSVIGSSYRTRGRPKGSRSNLLASTKEQEDAEETYFKMWPFRYFGQYTVAEDTLDPEDIIFPRANTRVGIKFQTSVPATGSSLPPPGPDIPERGTDETVEILSCVSRMVGDEISNLELCKTNLAARPDLLFDVDWLTEIIRRLSVAYLQKESLSNVTLKNPFRTPKWKKDEVRYTDREWSEDEIRMFSNAVMEYGPELRSVRDQLGSRTFPEVVRFFAKWKANHLREENHRILEARRLGKPLVSQQNAATAIDEEKSIVNVKTDGRSLMCAACRTRQSSVWWKGPRGLSSPVLCDECGIHWRKYGDLSLKTPSDLLSGKQRTTVIEKREGTPLAGSAPKRMKLPTMPVPPQPPLIKRIPCQCCKRSEPIGKVIRCIQCCMSIHAGSYGAITGSSFLDQAEAEGWLCDVCQNDTTLEASLVGDKPNENFKPLPVSQISDCVLCPNKRKNDKKRAVTTPNLRDPKDAGFLRAKKPTEGQNWAHILCSLYASEVVFTDASRLRLVEGVSSIAQARWEAICSICNQPGVLAKCSVCPAAYHPTCGWLNNHRMAFEIITPKVLSKRDLLIEFKGETGVMRPVIYCLEHEIGPTRKLYDFCDVNEGGESALQIFVRNYKQAAVDNSYGLLRKARRLDLIMQIHEKTSGKVVSPVSNQQCFNCKTEYSPFFYPVESETLPDLERKEGLQECQVCHFERLSSSREKESSHEPLVPTATVLVG